MSRYLGYVLDREQITKLESISIFQHEFDWVNQQIRDEFRNILKDVRIEVTKNVRAKIDLLVLPFTSTFATEYLPVERMLQQIDARWITVYGVTRRTIQVIPRKDFSAFCRKEKILAFAAQIRYRRRLKFVVKTILRCGLKLRLLNA